MKIMHVRAVETAPKYKLVLVFSDGTRGGVDFAPLLAEAPFAALKDAALFAEAFVEDGAVNWPGGVAVATETLYAIAHGLKRPETREDVDANELAVSLRDLRRVANMSQVEIAKAMGVDQGQFSRFENGHNCQVATLEKYVVALGGRLELVAVLGDKRIPVRMSVGSASEQVALSRAPVAHRSVGAAENLMATGLKGLRKLKHVVGAAIPQAAPAASTAKVRPPKLKHQVRPKRSSHGSPSSQKRAD
jgi:predicted XRE-type DNA-binding protein